MKLRVVWVPAGYVVERKGLFGWRYVGDPDFGPTVYKTFEEADKAALYYKNPPPPKVMKEY